MRSAGLTLFYRSADTQIYPASPHDPLPVRRWHAGLDMGYPGWPKPLMQPATLVEPEIPAPRGSAGATPRGEARAPRWCAAVAYAESDGASTTPSATKASISASE